MIWKHRVHNRVKIKQQLYMVYVVAVFFPILVLGVFLVGNTYRLLDNYHRDLLKSDNLRVKTFLFEITTQVYNLSEELAFDEEIAKFVSTHHYVWDFEVKRASAVKSIDNYEKNFPEIESIEVYTDNSAFMDYKQFHFADKKKQKEEWFSRALEQTSVLWVPMSHIDEYGNEYWNLCLVREIPLIQSKHHAVLVIRLSDNYLRTRIDSASYDSMISVDKKPVFFSSNRDYYGKKQFVPIDYHENYFQYEGNRIDDGVTVMVELSTLHMYQSGAKVYICTENDKAYDNIKSIVFICLLIILVALIIPGVLIHFFADYFSNRILMLRKAMHQVSNDDYEIVNSLKGKDEVSEAFSDLEIMVAKIKKKDADVYEAHLNKKELEKQQQIMKYKMLSNQINPHFLYNTLETIRMKAFKANDREVATAIKLLGKSMRYVLENTGNSITSLSREIEHVETYLAIQKLRFVDKFESIFKIADHINPEEISILPLVIQPIVENAILHGLEEKEHDGLVTISIYTRIVEGRELLYIDVSDNGEGMDKASLQLVRQSIEQNTLERSSSIGLYNINQRIKLKYGMEYGLTVSSICNEGTTVSLCFPVGYNKKVM